MVKNTFTFHAFKIFYFIFFTLSNFFFPRSSGGHTNCRVGIGAHISSLSSCFFFFKFFIARCLLYSIVLVSAIHQHESATGIHMSPSLSSCDFDFTILVPTVSYLTLTLHLKDAFLFLKILSRNMAGPFILS